MKVITQKDLFDILADHDAKKRGTEFVSVVIDSEPSKMRKTDNPYIGCTKVTAMSGAIGYDYGNSVNNQLMREGKTPDFIAENRKWGTRISPRLVEHKGQYYMSMKIQHSDEPVYVLNGNQIPWEEIKPFIPETAKSQTQEEAGVEKEVIVRDIKLNSIKQINIDNEQYSVV